jgi:adhesin transport system outer membrane protein
MKLVPGMTGLIAGMIISSSVTAETLQEAVQTTIKENPILQQSKDQRLAFQEQIDQVRAEYFPKIDLAAGYGFEQSNNPTTRNRNTGQLGSVQYGREETSIQLRQMIFDGLATPNEINRTKANTNAQAYQVYADSEYLAQAAVEAYLNILKFQELVDIAKENLDNHLSINDQIVMRSQQGVGKRADIDQSSGRVSRAESNLRAEEGNLTDAKTAYLKIIGALPGKLVMPAHPKAKLPKSIDEAVELAAGNHPQLKSANADIDEAHYQHETAKAPFMPRVDFEGGASWNNNLDGIPGKNEDYTAMLRLRYNLLNGGKDLARRKETAELMSVSKDVRDNAYRDVVKNMREAWVSHEVTESQLEFLQNHRDTSIKATEAYKMQFNIGQRTLLDLLDTTNEMYTANRNYIDAKYRELFAAHRILAAMAGLNSYLGVQLPKEATTLED